MVTLVERPTPDGRKIAMVAADTGSDDGAVGVNSGTIDQVQRDVAATSADSRLWRIEHAPADGGEAVADFGRSSVLGSGAHMPGRVRTAGIWHRTAGEWLVRRVGGRGPITEPSQVAYDARAHQADAIGPYTKEPDRRNAARTANFRPVRSTPPPRTATGSERPPSRSWWFETVRSSPGTVRCSAKGGSWSNRPTVNETKRQVLFGQTARGVALTA